MELTAIGSTAVPTTTSLIAYTENKSINKDPTHKQFHLYPLSRRQNVEVQNIINQPSTHEGKRNGPTGWASKNARGRRKAKTNRGPR